jgi:hypothetical protein
MTHELEIVVFEIPQAAVAAFAGMRLPFLSCPI